MQGLSYMQPPHTVPGIGKAFTTGVRCCVEICKDIADVIIIDVAGLKLYQAADVDVPGREEL